MGNGKNSTRCVRSLTTIAGVRLDMACTSARETTFPTNRNDQLHSLRFLQRYENRVTTKLEGYSLRRRAFTSAIRSAVPSVR